MSPPISCSIITRAVALETRNEPLAITSCWRSQSFSVVSSSERRQRQPGVVDDEVDAAEREHRRVDHGLHGGRVGDVDLHADGDVGPPISAAAAAAFSSDRSAIDDAGALGGELLGRGLADAAGRAGDQRDAGGERLGLRHPLELGLLQRPVLDPELLRLVDRGVRRETLGAAHHVDRVDVELAGHAGGLLVLAEAEHADAGHQHDQRVGAADRGAVLRACRS